LSDTVRVFAILGTIPWSDPKKKLHSSDDKHKIVLDWKKSSLFRKVCSWDVLTFAIAWCLISIHDGLVDGLDPKDVTEA
jgi:hypothetical protein